MVNPNSLKVMPRLESVRLIFRKFSENDIQDIFEYASNPEVSKYLPWDKHESIHDTKEFIKKSAEIFESSDTIDWGIELKSENKLIGSISIRNWNDENRCCDIGYLISPKYWGNGYAVEALNEIIRFGFESFNANRIEAHCDEDNTASYKVMEKAGMKYEGTLRKKVFIKGKFINMKFYSILNSEYFNK